MRRHFRLPEEDEQYLQALGLDWETVREGSHLWLLLHSWPILEDFTPDHVLTGMAIASTYPDTQIDMIYFHPELRLVDGRQILKITNQDFDGKCWQRWSRHRTPQNPWRRGIDNLEMHLYLVRMWLARAAGRT